MTYLSLYRKWRPATFTDVPDPYATGSCPHLGQEHVTETLAGALREDRVAHAYLFSGPKGTGKTSTARILAKSLNCEKGPTPEPCGKCVQCREISDGISLDVFEMDAASHTSVDDVRSIRDSIPLASASGGRKVYIIDEAHQLSTPAFNALLKILEEPPSHVVFVLCTTESHKLPATVVSRCQRFEFRRISASLLSGHLSAIAEQEGFKVEPAALALIARHARGSARDALALLDQAAGSAQGSITRQDVVQMVGEAPEDVLMGLVSAIAAQDVAEVFRQVEAIVERGWDPRQLLRQLMEQFRSLFLVSHGAHHVLDADEQAAVRLRELVQVFTPAHLEWVLRVLGEAQADVRSASHPRLTLEVTLARAACLQADTAPLVARVERLERVILQGGHGPQAPAVQVAPTAATTSAPPRPRTTAAGPPPAPANGASQATPAADIPQPAPTQADDEPQRPEAEAQQQPADPAEKGLQEQWDAFLAGVRARKRTTHALIKEAWPLEVNEGVLVVGFERSFHAEAIQKTEHTAHLAAASKEAFGRSLKLRPEVKPGTNPAKAQVAAPVAATPDELVMKGLGAEIVEETDV
ncbi:MAG TPA: DNA polymerase III subunit gamma/tau [Actinomycetota bacterium]|nr:DNA polymerase III subunit gamma/tau [Actinomycetota bacterium]